MADIKSTVIVPIAVYCFVVSFFSAVLAGGEILSNKAISSIYDLYMCLPGVAFIILAVGLVIIGIGILKLNNLCWKILFFSLAICVGSVASIILVLIAFLFINSNFVFIFFETIRIPSQEWFSFFFFFMSEIIVLYYLTQDEVVSHFGGMGNLISPF